MAAERTVDERLDFFIKRLRADEYEDERLFMEEVKAEIERLHEELQRAQADPAYDYGFSNGVRAAQVEVERLRRIGGQVLNHCKRALRENDVQWVGNAALILEQVLETRSDSQEGSQQ